jgi:hypothetical protein
LYKYDSHFSQSYSSLESYSRSYSNSHFIRYLPLLEQVPHPILVQTKESAATGTIVLGLASAKSAESSALPLFQLTRHFVSVCDTDKCDVHASLGSLQVKPFHLSVLLLLV